MSGYCSVVLLIFLTKVLKARNKTSFIKLVNLTGQEKMVLQFSYYCPHHF